MVSKQIQTGPGNKTDSADALGKKKVLNEDKMTDTIGSFLAGIRMKRADGTIICILDQEASARDLIGVGKTNPTGVTNAVRAVYDDPAASNYQKELLAVVLVHCDQKFVPEIYEKAKSGGEAGLEAIETILYIFHGSGTIGQEKRDAAKKVEEFIRTKEKEIIELNLHYREEYKRLWGTRSNDEKAKESEELRFARNMVRATEKAIKRFNFDTTKYKPES